MTGQPNAMGGREVGGMANLLSAHRDRGNATHRAEVAARWGVANVPSKPGKTAVEMFQAAADGEIRALWIACTNPAQSMPDQATVRRSPRARARRVCGGARGFCHGGHLRLRRPAAARRHLGREDRHRDQQRAPHLTRAHAVPAPGLARHDWAIAVQFAHQLEARLRPGLPTLFPCTTEHADQGAKAVCKEHRESTRGRDLDITGLSWGLLESQGRSSGRCLKAPPPARPACMKTASSPPTMATSVLLRTPGSPARCTDRMHRNPAGPGRCRHAALRRQEAWPTTRRPAGAPGRHRHTRRHRARRRHQR